MQFYISCKLTPLHHSCLSLKSQMKYVETFYAEASTVCRIRSKRSTRFNATSTQFLLHLIHYCPNVMTNDKRGDVLQWRVLRWDVYVERWITSSYRYRRAPLHSTHLSCPNVMTNKKLARRFTLRRLRYVERWITSWCRRTWRDPRALTSCRYGTRCTSQNVPLSDTRCSPRRTPWKTTETERRRNVNYFLWRYVTWRHFVTWHRIFDVTTKYIRTHVLLTLHGVFSGWARQVRAESCLCRLGGPPTPPSPPTGWPPPPPTAWHDNVMDGWALGLYAGETYFNSSEHKRCSCDPSSYCACECVPIDRHSHTLTTHHTVACNIRENTHTCTHTHTPYIHNTPHGAQHTWKHTHIHTRCIGLEPKGREWNKHFWDDFQKTDLSYKCFQSLTLFLVHRTWTSRSKIQQTLLTKTFRTLTSHKWMSANEKDLSDVLDWGHPGAERIYFCSGFLPISYVFEWARSGDACVTSKFGTTPGYVHVHQVQHTSHASCTANQHAPFHLVGRTLFLTWNSFFAGKSFISTGNCFRVNRNVNSKSVVDSRRGGGQMYTMAVLVFFSDNADLSEWHLCVATVKWNVM